METKGVKGLAIGCIFDHQRGQNLAAHGSPDRKKGQADTTDDYHEGSHESS